MIEKNSVEKVGEPLVFIIKDCMRIFRWAEYKVKFQRGALTGEEGRSNKCLARNVLT